MDRLVFLIHFHTPRPRAGRSLVLAVLPLCLLASRAYADAALMLAEPYNRPGRPNPVAHAGHAGVYLTRDLRHHVDDAASVPRGEAGVVISRYDRIGKFALRSGAPRTFD